MQKNLERQADIDAERQKALIRTQSQALVWTGPSEDLTTTIRRWFESGWLPGATIDEALRLASIHFVKPDGMPVIQFEAVPAAAPTPADWNAREAFVIPLLEKNGWSPLDWAVEAKVSPATAQDYLGNKTKPYASTRMKLAKALGISVQQLPR